MARLRQTNTLKKVIRKRRLLRTGSWTLVIGFALLGLYAANVLLPCRVNRPVHSLPRPDPEPVQEGRVEEVVDGDTLQLQGGIIVRLEGIDTPEADQDGYHEATAALKTLVFNKNVKLSYGKGDRVDRYGRLLAFVTTPSGSNVNQALIRAGRGWIYRLEEDAEPFERFLEAQQEAMESGAGLWAKFKDRRGPFISNRNTRIFHKETCAFGRKTSSRNRRTFERLREAFQEGYSPCRSCFRQPMKGR